MRSSIALLLLTGCALGQNARVKLLHRLIDPALWQQEQPSLEFRAQFAFDQAANQTTVDDSADTEGYFDHAQGKVYHLRLVDADDGQAALGEILVDACTLYHRKSKPFKEELVLHYDWHGELDNLTYRTADSKYTCDPTLDISQYTRLGSPSRSTLSISIERAKSPLEMLKDPPANIEWDDDGRPKKPAPPKSFVAKYWMYAIPFVLVLLLPAPDENDQQQQQQKDQ